jgi:hypothetical protein
VTTIVNTKTNKVDVINSQVIKPNTKPRVQVISGSIVHIAEKKFTEIKEIVSNIKTNFGSKVTVESIPVKDLNGVKVYTPIISTTSGKSQIVYVFDKKTKEVKEV